MVKRGLVVVLSVLVFVCVLVACGTPPESLPGSVSVEESQETASSSTWEMPVVPIKAFERGEEWQEPGLLDYEVMKPLTSNADADRDSYYFLNVMKNGKWGTIRFDGKVIFPVKYEEAPVTMCSGVDGHIHANAEIYDMYEKNPDAYWECGFPYVPTYGGHGICTAAYVVQHPVTKGFAVVTLCEGPVVLSLKEGWRVLYNKEAPLAAYTVAPKETAEDFSDLHTYLEPMYGPSSGDGFTYKYGLINLDTMAVVKTARYDRISNLQDKHFAIAQNDKWAFYSVSKKDFITEFIYEAEPAENEWINPVPLGFLRGYCPVLRNGKYGFINTSGEEVVPPQFDSVTHSVDSKAWVKENGTWCLLDIYEYQHANDDK